MVGYGRHLVKIEVEEKFGRRETTTLWFLGNHTDKLTMFTSRENVCLYIVSSLFQAKQLTESD